MTFFDFLGWTQCLMTRHEWSGWYRRNGSKVWRRHCFNCGRVEKDDK